MTFMTKRQQPTRQWLLLLSTVLALPLSQKVFSQEPTTPSIEESVRHFSMRHLPRIQLRSGTHTAPNR